MLRYEFKTIKQEIVDMKEHFDSDIKNPEKK